jgi:hypothetical protein
MPFKISLPKSSLIELESTTGVWNKLTEHNRGPLEMSTERIEETKRMANGTLRKYYVADKKSFSVSWDFIPGAQTHLVDTAWSVNDLQSFYSSAVGKASFQLRVRKADGTYEGPYTVIFTSFSPTILKRGVDTFYNLSIEMQEV